MTIDESYQEPHRREPLIDDESMGKLRKYRRCMSAYNFQELLHQHRLKAQVVLEIHDSFIVNAPEHEIERVRQLFIQNCCGKSIRTAIWTSHK